MHKLHLQESTIDNYQTLQLHQLVIKSNQIKSNQIKSNQIKSNQINKIYLQGYKQRMRLQRRMYEKFKS